MNVCGTLGGPTRLALNRFLCKVLRTHWNPSNYKLFSIFSGHKLQDSGYEKWYNSNYKQYDCGVIYGNELYYQAVECGNELPFICEMDVSA